LTSIKVYKPEDREAWDHYILSHALAGPYLTSSWKEAIEHSYGHRTMYLISRDGDFITGVLPMVLIKPFLGRAGLISLPYCDYGGLITDSLDGAGSLLEKALELAAENKAALEIRNAHVLPWAERELVQITEKCRMTMQLPDSSEQLWKSFKSKLRSQIKRPVKEGLVSRLGSTEMIQDFYRVFCRNMRDLGSPVHSLQWINCLVKSFGENARVCVVYKDGSPVAGGILLLHARTATVPWASTLRGFNRLSPNMLLYWTFLEYAADNGFACFDFGRSSPGEGTYLFKKQWGAKPEPLGWYRLAGVGSANGTSGVNGSLRCTGERIWRSLPLPAANFLGPRIRKYIDL